MTEAPLEVDLSLARRDVVIEARFSLQGGECLALVGPSGAGKTTVLEAIAGLAPAAPGSVRIGGHVVTGIESARLCGVALVRQPTTLFPHLCVSDNIFYGVAARARPRGGELASILDTVGLAGLGGTSPLALSGGQRQRVALARAIMRPFGVLLLDEPFSALDSESARNLRQMAGAAVRSATLGVDGAAVRKAALGAAGHDGGKSAAGKSAAGILVSHDLADAQAFGDRLAVMDAGRLLQVGRPDDVVRAPLTRRVAELCGYASFLPGGKGRLLAVHPDRVLAGERPEMGVVLKGTVTELRPFGARYEVVLAGLELVSDHVPHVVSPPAVTGIAAFLPAHFEGALRAHVESPACVGTELVVTVAAPPLVATMDLGRDSCEVHEERIA